LAIRHDQNNNDLEILLAEAYNTRGGIYAEKKDYVNAVFDFENAVKYDPQNENYKDKLRKAKFGKSLLEE
jgi:tetratricopeptide (TPR) repeat protein